MDKFDIPVRVKLLSCNDKYTKLKPEDLGWAIGYDQVGSLLVEWDNGSSLSMIPGIDDYIFLRDKKGKLITKTE